MLGEKQGRGTNRSEALSSAILRCTIVIVGSLLPESQPRGQHLLRLNTGHCREEPRSRGEQPSPLSSLELNPPYLSLKSYSGMKIREVQSLMINLISSSGTQKPLKYFYIQPLDNLQFAWTTGGEAWSPG